MEQVQIRTDLALEARESVSEKEEHLHGVQVEEEYKEESEIKITRVTIESKNGARLLGKAMGTYVTLEAPNMGHPHEDNHEEIARELAYQIKSLLPKEKGAAEYSHYRSWKPGGNGRFVGAACGR